MSQAGNGRGTKGVRQDRIRDMEQEARLWVLARFGSAELRRMNDLSGLSKRPGAYGLAFTPSPDADHLYARIYRPWSDGRFLDYGKGVHGGLLGARQLARSRSSRGRLRPGRSLVCDAPDALGILCCLCRRCALGSSRAHTVESHRARVRKSKSRLSPRFPTGRPVGFAPRRSTPSQSAIHGFRGRGRLSGARPRPQCPICGSRVRRASGSNSPDPTWRQRRPKASTVKGPLDPHSRQAMSCWETA